MAKHHKIVAYRLDGFKDGVKVSSLTESPRGTRVFAGQVMVDLTGKTKEEVTQAFEQAFRDLQDT